MKKFKFLLLGLTIVAMAVSCSKDEDASVSGNKYESTYAKVSGTISGQSITVEYKTKADLQTNNMYEVLEFKAGGAFYVDGINSGSWEQSGSNVTVVSGDKTIPGTIDGNLLVMKMTLTDADGTYNAEIHYTKM